MYPSYTISDPDPITGCHTMVVDGRKTVVISPRPPDLTDEEWLAKLQAKATLFAAQYAVEGA
jgi:hypothetical protein